MSSPSLQSASYKAIPEYIDFERFHVRKMTAGSIHLTETEHPQGLAIPTHEHERVSLYLVLSGLFSEKFGRRSTERRAGQLIFTPMQEPHSNVFEGPSSRCFIIEVEPQIVAKVLECGSLPSAPTCFYGPCIFQAGRLYRRSRLKALPLKCSRRYAAQTLVRAALIILRRWSRFETSYIPALRSLFLCTKRPRRWACIRFILRECSGSITDAVWENTYAVTELKLPASR